MRRSRFTGMQIAGGLIGCVFLCGCGGGVERHDFSGKATFEGEPIVYGSAVFIPDTAAGHSGPTGMARIVNGQYDTTQETGQGVLPGKHIIRVTAYPSQPPAHEDETVEVETVEPLFLNWEIQADLTETTYDIVVPAEARGFTPESNRPNAAPTGNEP